MNIKNLTGLFQTSPKFARGPIWAMVREKFQASLPAGEDSACLEGLELIKLTQRKAVFLADPSVPDPFPEACGDTLTSCLEEVMGSPVEVVLRREKPKVEKIRKTFHRLRMTLLSLLLLCAAGLLAVLGGSALQNLNFRETFYQVGSGKVKEGFRIIQLSDLHGTAFGGDNSELVRRIGLLQPDLIAMTGDCIDQDDQNHQVTLDLCRQLAEIAPTFYIYGNDEETLAYGIPMTLESIDELFQVEEEQRDPALFQTLEDPLREELEASGVQVLQNQSVTVEVNGILVDVYGALVENPSAFWPYAGEAYESFLQEDTDHFKLFLCHEPYLFTMLGQDGSWGDLSLCGHTHGGVWRLPLLGGLYERAGGLLPEWRNSVLVYGSYTVVGCPVVVSGGLSNRGFVRVNNQPELVVVDVDRY